ncbi:hypothetical protein D3C81_1899820 [compost metagenome]
MAEIIPAVTEFSRLNGEPMAMTHSPTRILFESPMVRRGRFPPSIFSRATSVRASAPITFALNSRLSVRVT